MMITSKVQQSLTPTRSFTLSLGLARLKYLKEFVQLEIVSNTMMDLKTVFSGVPMQCAVGMLLVGSLSNL